ncbi:MULTISPECIES: glycosyltransferase family 2 protein [unclassified Prosthecochloris]|uniref:glycosyltransferase family 2 protein n=1 Tax=unclassified Prosthecochloris TaxID=2632826 RepID=UPI00223D85EE|nr:MULTISPECIES: glycosyltransferase family 2 protein [unclassified Prosthecochloris]UZJ36822.1 glycosyltransferase family 2 protein [Prosthecochloris sp. SCSIO W1103]UZJ39762.1 glycosyltransferase family 2 protein [Prosthecochloris sp. SCSIO W1102]
MQPTPLLSVIVPFYNEEESLPLLLDQLFEAMSDKELQGLFTQPFSFELLMIDDGSTDGSLDFIREEIVRKPELKLVSLQRNFGKTAALSAGFKYAEGEYIVTLDADLQDDPFAIKCLIEKLQEGYDLVSGWKRERNDPLSKTIPSRVFNMTTRLFTGIALHDFNCGLKAYRKKVIQSLDLYGEMHRYIPVLARWNGFGVSEIPVKHNPRRFGKTKFGTSRIFPGLFDFLTVLFITRYLRQPMHFFGMLSLLSFLVGFGISLYVTIGKVFFNEAVVNRPILFLGILLIILAVQFFSIGLLGEMLTRDASRTLHYTVRETMNVQEEKR